MYLFYKGDSAMLHRSFHLLLVIPFIFTLSGCWPLEKKEKEPNKMEIHEPEPLQIHEKAATETAINTHEEIINVVTDINFDAALKKGKPVIAKFWAEWCGPCQRMKPIFHELAREFGDKVTFVEINEKHRHQNNLMSKYNIESLPTFIFFNKNGKQVEKHEGSYEKEEFKKAIDNLINKGRP